MAWVQAKSHSRLFVEIWPEHRLYWPCMVKRIYDSIILRANMTDRMNSLYTGEFI